jgi:hypothetical protein
MPRMEDHALTPAQAAARLSDPGVEYEIDLGDGWSLPFRVTQVHAHQGIEDATPRDSLVRVFARVGAVQIEWHCEASGAPRRSS